MEVRGVVDSDLRISMTKPAMQPANADANASPQATAGSPPLIVRTPHGTEEVLKRLEKAARRGELPGFERGGPAIDGAAAAFTAEADAVPFEGLVVAVASPATDGGGTMLTLSVRLKPRMPWIFMISLVLAAYPGVILTGSMLRTLAPGATWLWDTVWWWYFPLAVVSIPLAFLPALNKSRRLAAASAAEVATKIRKLLGT
jgi:hypothetical protein